MKIYNLFIHKLWKPYLDTFSGLSKEVWWLALITLINRAGTMVIPFLSIYLTEELHFDFKDVGSIKSLDFYKYNADYVVSATLKRTPDSEYFDMKTTTDRVTKSRVYGVITFNLKGKTYQLNVYRDKELITTEGFENYLFLPFLDDTNGESTYGAGRYIDLKIPEGNTLTVDFNSAYNPYCAYDEKYSCPIVPNYLATTIEAGVKKYNKY